MVRRLVLLAALVAASLVAHADAAPTSASAFAGLYEIRLDRSGLREVLASTEGGVVEMSPDRTQVVVTRNYGDYDRVTLKDHARVPLIRVPGTGPGDIEGIQWSPDARTLLFNRADDSPCTPSATGCAIWDTWLVNASGSHLRRVSRNARYPAFSPSSKRITFLGNFSTYDDVGELSVSALDGSGLRILDQQREAWLPAWSPNGKCVAYTAATFPYSYSYEVQVACLNGLHRNLGSGVSLGWSPDGAILKNRVRERSSCWLGSGKGDGNACQPGLSQQPRGRLGGDGSLIPCTTTKTAASNSSSWTGAGRFGPDCSESSRGQAFVRSTGRRTVDVSFSMPSAATPRAAVPRLRALGARCAGST